MQTRAPVTQQVLLAVESLRKKKRVYCSMSGCPEAIFNLLILTLGYESLCIFRDGIESYLPWTSSRGERPWRYLREAWALDLSPVVS